MLFLDTDNHWIIARDRAELVAALLGHLDLNTVDLAALAAACFDCEPGDVIVVEE